MTDLASMEVRMNQQQLLTTDEDTERYLAECILVEQLNDPPVRVAPSIKRGGGAVRNGKHDVIDDGQRSPMAKDHDVRLTKDVRTAAECNIRAETKKYLRTGVTFAQSGVTLAQRLYALVKSELGLVLILLIYSLIGAAILSKLEGPPEEQRASNYTRSKQRFLRSILNATDLLSSVNFSSDDTYADLAVYTVIDNETDALERYNIARLTDELLDNSSSAIVRNLVELLDGFQEEMQKTRMHGQLDKGSMTWTYWGALFFCGSVFTTVGYGNIVPVTDGGRIATMIYALIGIPLCLIVLSRLGQALTRFLKYCWSYVRRFYYTGSCVRVRRMIPRKRLHLSLVQRIATDIRRRTVARRLKSGAVVVEAQPDEDDDVFVPYEIDDKFNLPPLVAVIIAFVYTLLGALMYMRWESWSYLDAFYFTFISLCTVGFGDIVPAHPKFFLATSVYLLIGFALIAMVINVVMESVSTTITMATDQMRDQVRNVGQRVNRFVPGNLRFGTPETVATVFETEGMPGAVWAETSVRRRSV